MSIAFSSNSHYLAVGGLQEFAVWDLKNARGFNEADALYANTGIDGMSVAFSPEGKTIAISDFSGSIQLWELKRPDVQAELELRRKAITLKGHSQRVKPSFFIGSQSHYLTINDLFSLPS